MFQADIKYKIKPVATHHADFEGVKQVKGQRSNQVNDEPRGQVVEANLPRIKNHLARFTDVSGAEVENDVWQAELERRTISRHEFVSHVLVQSHSTRFVV